MLGTAQNFVGWLFHTILPYLAMVTPIVFFHELGHFSVARAFGVKIETFSIGFGPTIVSWLDRHGTRWKISWIPLGGYVKFLGDMNAASVPDRDGLDRMPASERQGALMFKPLYQRALVVAAGPMANFVLAIVIMASFLVIFGEHVIPPVAGKVVPGSAAQAAGIHAGDLIVSVQGKSLDSFAQIRELVWDQAGHPMSVVVRRAGKEINLTVTPRLKKIEELGETEQVGQVGLEAPPPGQWKFVRYGPFTAVAKATADTWSIITTTMTGLWRMATGSISADQLHGPVGVVQITGKVAAFGVLALFQLAAFLSVSVGLINLFPIPILDGGHLLYYGCEAILGRPLGARAQDVGFRLGMAVILGFVVFATWNDLVRLNLF
jgi:regulator of sigma E protease